MLFFMVQVAVQSVKIEVIDEQEDDQRSGHAAGHYRKVVQKLRWILPTDQ